MVGVNVREFPAVLLAKRTKEKIMAEVQSLKPPVFIPPYPARHNPHEANANANSEAWLIQHLKGKQSGSAFFSDPKKMDLFIRSKINDLFARCYVEAEEEEATWMCCLGLWFFLIDDLLDERQYFSCPEDMAKVIVELNLIMMWSFPDDPVLYGAFVDLVNLVPKERRQAIIEDVDDKLAKARLHPGSVYEVSHLGPETTTYSDLWVKLVASAPSESVIRWGNSIQLYLLANVHEAEGRKTRNVLPVKDYIALRRNTSGVDCCLLISDYAFKFSTSLPTKLFESPEMRTFLDAINDIVSWHNDIYSFKKELLTGEVHNLVYVVSQERGCSFSEALVIALEMLYDRVQDLERAIDNLETITTPKNRWAVPRMSKPRTSGCLGPMLILSRVNATAGKRSHVWPSLVYNVLLQRKVNPLSSYLAKELGDKNVIYNLAGSIAR